MKKLIGLLFLVFIACGTVKKNKELDKNVFKTILKGTGGPLGLSSGFYVLNSEKEISEFKNIANFNSLKNIDFTKVTLVAVVDKVQNSGGYGIDVISFNEVEGKLICTYKKSSPGSTEIVTMSLTKPYHIVEIKKTNKKIIFKEL